jgi:hypothetical protein
MLDIDKKKKLVEELLSHLDKSQGEDFGKMVMEHKKPSVEIESIKAVKPEQDMDDKVNEAIQESPEDEAAESPEHEAMESPELEKAEHAGDDEKLSDEELAELLKKYLK